MTHVKKNLSIIVALLAIGALIFFTSLSKAHTKDHNETEIQSVEENSTTTPTVKKKIKQTASTPKTQIIKTANGEVVITLPTVPTPVKAIQLTDNAVLSNRSIKFSKRVPPNYIPHKFEHMKEEKVSTDTHIGEVDKGRISAYLRGEFIEVTKVKEKLEKAGFTVVATAPVNKQEDLVSVVFTNPDMIRLASKPNRGFMATLRVLVDTKEKNINITNPLYIYKGFLQEDYDDKEAKKILASIVEYFPHLKNSKDVLKFQLLPSYQFMIGMPNYEDMIEVATGDDLLERLKENKRVVFTQKLENGSVLAGITLSKRTRKFTKKVGRHNAALLPYPVLINKTTAQILDPKYYIAYMYPMLKMSEFMTIATIPDDIIKDAKRVFRKKKK